VSLPDSAVPGAASDPGGRSGGEHVNEVDEDYGSTSTLGPFLVGGFMLVVGLVMFWQIFKIHADGFAAQGPKFFPLIVISLWLVLSAIYLVTHLVKVLRRHAGHAAERFEHMVGAGWLVVLLVVYAFLLDPVGYWISTALFFVGSARAMGSRNLVRDVLVGVLLALVVYLSFTRALGVRLPEGVLGF
jgi:putative tricarboxylic transport membrane protein